MSNIKLRFLSCIATLTVAVSALAVQPACHWYFYQPEVPEHLID